ncbi:MAG: NERD domain-containing protein [Coriobacteriales bacterium]
MATMIPAHMIEDNGSYGEREIFNLLKDELPPEYYVFHSLPWKRKKASDIEEGESDFIVFHKDKGMVSIEVKSGGVECSGGAWTYIRTDNGARYDMKDPMKQADNCKHYLVELVKGATRDRRNGERQSCWVSSAVWFPSITEDELRGELPANYLPELVMYRTAMRNPRKRIDELFEFCGSPEKTNLTDRCARAIVNTLAPELKAIPTLYSKKLKQEEAFEQLTLTQSGLLDYLEEQKIAAIKGPAGTGKTMLGMEKARRLSKEGKTLFLCYNRFLRDSLRDFQAENWAEYGQIEIYNTDALATAKGAPIEELFRYPERNNIDYEHVVIDEAQDIPSTLVALLREYAVLNEGSFYVFYDANQYVQGDSFEDDRSYEENSLSAWLDEIECRLVLSVNCRNTLPIATTSGKPLALKPKAARKELDAEKPGFALCESQAAALKHISKLITRFKDEGRLSYSDICILTVKTESYSILSGVEKIGNHRIVSERSNEGVLFTTARKFKGLESDAVIVVDLDKNSF